MQPANGFAKKRCAWNDFDAGAQDVFRHMEGGSGVCHDRAIDRRMGKNRFYTSVK